MARRIPTLTIPYSELQRLITVAAKSAGTEPLLPVFMQVRLVEHDGHIEAIATDRYTIARVRGQAEAPKGLEFGLTVADWRNLLTVYKPRRRGEVTLALRVLADRVTVTRAEGVLAGPSDVEATYPVVEGAFPKLGHIYAGLNDVESRATTEPTTIAANLLARIPAEGWREGGVSIIARGPGKPAYAVGGDWLLVIMPLRLDAGAHSERFAMWSSEKAAA